MPMYASSHRNTNSEIRGVSSESRNAEKVNETNRTVNDIRSEVLKLKIMVQAMMELMVEQGVDPSLINAKIDEVVARPKTFEQPEKDIMPCPKCGRPVLDNGVAPLIGTCLYCGTMVKFQPHFSVGGEEEGAGSEEPSDASAFSDPSAPSEQDNLGFDNFGFGNNDNF